MRIVMPENQKAVYRVEGVAAALIKPETWERLFKGEIIGVIEPKPGTYALFINGSFVSVFSAKTETAACKKGMRDSERWKAVQEIEKKSNVIHAVEVVPGYPDFLHFAPDKLKWYEEKGLTPEHCANKVREIVKRGLGRLDSFMGVYSFMEEVESGGMKREGRD